MLFKDFKDFLKESNFMKKINNVDYTVKTNTKNENLGLSTPWELYRKELAALFASDKDIVVEEIMEDESGVGVYDLGIKAYKHKKFVALSQLLPENIAFGNVVLRIYTYDMENTDPKAIDYGTLIEDLFEGNDIFDTVLRDVDHVGMVHQFAVFKAKAVQFYADDLQDPYGNRTMLAQDLAKDILTPKCGANIKFCSSLIAKDEAKE